MFGFNTRRTVIVTGGTKGIGRGIARVFAKAGCNVVITGRDETAARACVAELDSLGDGGHTYLLGDVAKQDHAQRVVDVTLERFGAIDVLCANAGIYPQTSLDETTVEEIDRVYATNVRGTIVMVQACIEPLSASGHGRVIITSSITGPITANPGFAHYAASKAAQVGYMRTAALELASRKITVNAVLPGNIATEGLDELGLDYRSSMEAIIPLGHLGTPEDIGNACLFFASDEASFITGQTLVVDGGQVLPESGRL